MSEIGKNTGLSQSDDLENLFKAHWSKLCVWLGQRYGYGPLEPEDIAQAAFEKIFALDNMEEIRNPRAYLYTLASRSAIDSLRSRAVASRYIDEEMHKDGSRVEEITPERVYMAKADLKIVAEYMEQLPDQQREIVIRSRIFGQTYQEIGEQTGWSPAAISRHLQAALTRITC